jgi:phosphonate transport system substrate-binding protein
MKFKKLFLLMGLLVVAAMVLSACGGGNTAATEEPMEEPTEAPMEEPTEAPMEEPTEAPTEEPAPMLGSAEYPIKVLFVPSVDAQVIVSGGEVMAAALNEATGYTFEVSVPTSYAATIEEMCASPDDTIGFIPALGYVLANQLCGVQPGLAAVRYGWNVYWTGFYVARDSDYQTLEDLEGATWAYPDAGSTSGYLYPASIFADMGIEVGETVEAGNHNNAVLAVYNGQADVGTAFFSPPLLPEGTWAMGDNPDVPDDLVDSCGPNEDGKLYCGEIRVLDVRGSVTTEAPDIVQEVRILTLSKEIPNDTMSFSPDFPADMKQSILDAVTAFISEDNPSCLESICSEEFYNWTAVGPIADENFDGVRILVAQQGITLENLGE